MFYTYWFNSIIFGMHSKKGTNEQDNHDYQNDVTFETATETAKPRSYVKQGFLVFQKYKLMK